MKKSHRIAVIPGDGIGAVKKNLSEKKVRTIDLGGRSKTNEVGEDMVRILQSL